MVVRRVKKAREKKRVVVPLAYKKCVMCTVLSMECRIWKVTEKGNHSNELSQLGVVVLTFLAGVSSSQWTLWTSNLSAASLFPLATLTDNNISL